MNNNSNYNNNINSELILREMSQKAGHLTEVINFVKDDRNLRTFLVLMNKNFTWKRELMSFGLTERQVAYAVEFLLNKGLIEIETLEQIDIKILQLIECCMPYGHIHPDIQIYKITERGLNFALLVEPFIRDRLEELQPLIDKINQKISVMLPKYKQLIQEEQTQFSRKIKLGTIEFEVETPKLHEFKEELARLTTSKNKGLVLSNGGALALYQKPTREEIFKKRGHFYNGEFISANEYIELLKEVPEDKDGKIGVEESYVSENVKSRQIGLLNALGIDIDEKHDFKEILER